MLDRFAARIIWMKLLKYKSIWMFIVWFTIDNHIAKPCCRTHRGRVIYLNSCLVNRKTVFNKGRICAQKGCAIAIPVPHIIRIEQGNMHNWRCVGTYVSKSGYTDQLATGGEHAPVQIAFIVS